MILILSEAERARLRAGALAVFEGRVVRDAQPPVGQAALDLIGGRCSGPLPDGLVALWRTTFGGTLDYELSAELDGRVSPVSFTELFYPGSDGYRDLWGWLAHESALAEEASERRGEAWSGKLDHLPFGGAEHYSRVYVRVAPGPDHGAVFAWLKGPPHRRTDVAAKIARDVPSLFRALRFERDPRTTGPHEPGAELLAAISRLGDEALEEKLCALVGAAVRR